MNLILIAAVSQNRVIGNNGQIPWYFSEDLKRFKELTLKNPVLMGRKTYDSIIKKLGSPLPDRLNVVLSKNPNVHETTVFCESLPRAIDLLDRIYDEAYVIKCT